MKRLLICCFLTPLAVGLAGCGDSKDKQPQLSNPPPSNAPGPVAPIGESKGKGGGAAKPAAD